MAWTPLLLLAAAVAQAPPPAAVPAASAPPSAVAADPAGVAPYAGLRVREIQLVPAWTDPAGEARMRERIVQPVGEPLDRVKLRRSIQNLYATGEYSNIRVDGQRTPEGEVTLVFIAERNFFVGFVRVDGIPRHGPTTGQLVNAAKLDLGSLYSPENAAAGAENIRRILRDHGFYETKVSFDTTPHPATQQIDVRFHITAGPRARVGQVVFRGASGYTDAQLFQIAGIRSGDEVTSGKAQRALQRLRKKYNKRERLEAEVALERSEYHADSNTVDFTFNVHAGPQVEIGVRGARVSKSELKKYVPVYEENAVDEDLLNEGKRNLRNFMQSRGYFDARVDFERPPLQNDTEKIEYIIDEGERHKLLHIELDGNRYFPDELIRERMLMQPAGWLLTHGRFSQALLARDLESISDLYHANGFQEVKIASAVQDDYHGDTGKMVVTLHIGEGTQTRVGTLQIVGNSSVPEAELRDQITSGEGQPFSDFNVASDRDAILNYYFNHGFPQATFEAVSEPDAGDKYRMDLTYTIHEGERVFVDHVYISGLQYTRPYVVDRELEVHDGAPLSQADILETQRRLYDLGIFSQVDIAVQNPEGATQNKDLLVQLTEAKRWTFDYGFGLEVSTGSDPGKSTPQGRTGVSPRVSLDITRINFLGRNHTLIFRSRVGRLQKRGLFSYVAPRWMDNEDLKLTFTAFYDDTADVRTFTAQRLEGSVQLEHKVSRFTTLLYRLAYRRVKVDPRTLVISPQLIPLFSQPVRIGMPSFTYIRDKRDDPLDSHKGMYTAADVGVAAGFLGSQSTFARFLLQNSTYHPFQKGRWVFARSTRIGVEQPFGTGTDRIIPLPELFFAGGTNSHRGFAINQAGPRDRDTGFPLGGEAMFINNLELRTPPIPLPYLENNVSAVIFHDMGNVFARPSDMWPGIFRTRQPNRDQCFLLTVTSACRFDYNSQAVGAGIRYKTPIGPVRIDFGYNLNPPVFPIRSEARSDTLTHFNFYFSLGQTF